MKSKHKFIRCLLGMSLFFVGISSEMAAQTPEPPAPTITVYQYRRVAGTKRDEFIRRETTYWAEIAKKALASGNLTFWALLEKVGGYDLENSSNFLFVNTFKDIDKVGEIYSTAALKAAFPNLTVDKIETNSISTVTSQFFLHDEGWEQAAGAVPEKDFNYISMVYHNSSAPADLISLEKKHWGPFIKGAMDKKQTTQMGWGNAIVLSPHGSNIHFNTVSYDLYPNLKEALNPTWDPKTVLPTEGLTAIGKLETEGRGSVVYHIIKVVAGN